MQSKRQIVLASSSPRRQFLMKEAGFDFVIRKPDVEEDFPFDMPVEKVAMFLAEKKANFFRSSLGEEIIVTADTVVILGNEIMNKPGERAEAVAMLSKLSGRVHKVITGVSLLAQEKQTSFQDETLVTFKRLTPGEIDFYVDQYKPYDKAGAYGAQDWIGMVAIEKIEGSYFNVMGLPIHLVYAALTTW
jgi:septum formation protein